MREIEVKLKANNLTAVENRLRDMDCVLSEPISQHDVVYSLQSSSEEFESAKEGDVIIRIRHLKNTAELNLKQQKSSEMDNLEYETEIKDPHAMHKILETLGWHPVVEVKKYVQKGNWASTKYV